MCRNMNKAVLIITAYCLLAGQSLAVTTLVDDFDSYSTGPVNTVTTNWKTFAGGGTVTIAADPANPSNKVLDFLEGTGSPGGYGILSGGAIIASGETKTLFFRCRQSGGANSCVGMTDIDAPNNNSWGEQSNQVRLYSNTVQAIATTAGPTWDPVPGKTMTANTWYNIWVVTDHATQTYRIYMNSTPGAGANPATDRVGTLATNPFRANNTNALDRFSFLSWGSAHVFFDDIYVSDGENLTAMRGKRASAPNPADVSTYDGINVTLAWAPGRYADKHDVYFGNNFNDVNNAKSSDLMGPAYVYKARQSVDANSYTVSGLIPGTTYYWRIDEVNAPPTTIYKGSIWRFTVNPLTAYNPSPLNGAILVDPNANLSWSKGMRAVTHKVYFDPSKAKVQARIGCAVNGVSRTDPNYIFGPLLTLGGTYYWAIDEVNVTTWSGPVWSFTTWPDIPTEPNLVGWWKFEDSGGSNSKTLDSSGHNRHGTLMGSPTYATGKFGQAIDLDGIDDWVSVGSVGISGAAPRTIAGWAKMNTTTTPAWTNVFGFTGGGNYSHFNIVVSGGDAPPLPAGWYVIHIYWWQQPIIGPDLEWHHFAATYDRTTIRWYGDGQLIGEQAYALTTTDNVQMGKSSGNENHFPGLIDDVRIYNKALTQAEIAKIASSIEAWGPNPANNAEIPPGVISLTWMPGIKAVKHDVYFSDNWDDVNDANSLDLMGPAYVYKARQDPCNYGPLTLNELAKTYYWRIDEVNGPDIWRGNIWRFTVADYLVVDDFESYTNSDPNIIFKTWKDGVGYSPGNGTGSQAGYRDPNYAELTIIHEGRQAMPVDYNNLKLPYDSNVSRTFAAPQDWTDYGVNLLSLWIRGHPVSVGSFVRSGSEPNYIYTMTASGTDIWNVPDLRRPSRFHDEFHYAYIQVSGDCAIAARVESITNTNAWAKAGVMIRDSTDANSAHAMTCLTPSPANGISFQHRDIAGGPSTNDINIPNINPPYWIDLERAGNTFTAYYSSDGSNWYLFGSTTITMTDPICIGLSLTAHNAAATCTAVFSKVKFVPPVTPSWTSQDIGIKSNVAAPVYVTVQDSNAKTATITHDDPNIALATTYQEWLIPLARFTFLNSNLDLKNIQKITLGVGNRGTGTLYFDDIRLYIPRCMSGRPGPAADFTGSDCAVDYRDLQILTNNWLVSTPQNLAIDMNENGTIDLRDYAILASMWLEEVLWPPPVTIAWGYEFKNDANCYDPGPPRDANDLHLEFNGPVYLVNTGPFTSFTGNGTNKVTLSAGVVAANRSTIIRVGTTGGEKTLNKWWWTDATHQRISKEMTGVGPSCKKIN